jgi:hypothetical protein
LTLRRRLLDTHDKRRLAYTFHACSDDWLSFILSGNNYWRLNYWRLNYCEINLLP